jgi:hypothetical protein
MRVVLEYKPMEMPEKHQLEWLVEKALQISRDAKVPVYFFYNGDDIYIAAAKILVPENNKEEQPEDV